MSNILVIESGEDTLRQLENSISAKDFCLEGAHNGEEAVDKAKELQPDVILLNADLSDTNSVETCKRLKSDPETENIPVIFLATDPSNGNGKEAANLLKSLETGANDCISSQSNPEEVCARIQVALRFKRSMNQADALATQLNELNAELYQRNLQVERELYVARQLQQSLLPPIIKDDESSEPDLDALPTFSKCHYKNDKVKISGVYLPCDALGGDLYDVIPFGNKSIGVSVADVSGHGVPAGFITAIFKSAFYRTTHNVEKPGDVFYQLNNELVKIIKTGDYITGIYCRLIDEGRRMEYTGAGHPYPMLYRAKDDTLVRLTENGTPLIWFADMEYPTVTVDLEPGDKILIFSDGITEMKNPRNELFGEEALEKLYLELVRKVPNRILDTMIEHLSDYTEGHPLEDDMSLVFIEID
ncbi:MAG: fused response regulator/phosphatase [Vampirovibrio sp.]|nr:fused response regulator/phosphatase [Vampirovibrio sp.]